MPNTTVWTPDAVRRRGSPTPLESSKAGKSGGARKLNAFELDIVWDEIITANRAAAPWGALAMWREREAA